ncbi:MAG: flagellar FliJ family protein [Planctomycetota bacterium]|nr:flagellar FliJ family protein [Planctomycetota bacterium]
MPRFVFKLEAVLEQRRHAERQKQRAVAALEAARQELEAAIARGQREIRACKEDLRALLGASAAGPVELAPVRLQAVASLHAQARTQRLALKLAGVYKQLDAARAELLSAATARKAVELLRERRLAEWKRDLARRENAELDEIATIRAARLRTPGTH